MSFFTVEPAPARLNRSELAVPGSQPQMFEKAAKSAADVVFLDLEDAVAPDDKAQARKNIIQAIGDAQQMWLYGTEEAFTIIPNFLSTGILAVGASAAMLVWSVGYVQAKHGALVFLLLFLLLIIIIFFLIVLLLLLLLDRRPQRKARSRTPLSRLVSVEQDYE